MLLPDLPIVEVLGQLRAALIEHGRAVVTAPPGAGKSTIVPLALLDEPWRGAAGRIVVLEPRRLATRAVARRMAELAGSAVGELVGFQTRDERRIGQATRIEVLTEGVLTRRLQHDPELPGVAAVIFDEVHERNLTTDLGLAFTLDAAATLRPDLRIVAMSATADTARFARLLGGDGDLAPVLSTADSPHPVDIRWLPRRKDEWLEPAIESAVRRALGEADGDVLVFLPGIGEIDRVAERLHDLAERGVDVRRLAGAVGVEEQDDALAPSPAGRRRVVLATDIAETSLTVEGVHIVIDGGLARTPRFDTGHGMTRLTTVAISRDSADQRAGRAGRLGPGVAYRLSSRMEHGTRPAHRAAEVTQVDLAGFVLELAAWGTAEADLAFLDRPPAPARRQAEDLLRALGALDPTGGLTELGRRMVALPAHPRLARMLADRRDTLSCVVAALVDERDVLRGGPTRVPADLSLRVAVVCGQTTDDRADRRAVANVRRQAEDLGRRAGVDFDPSGVDPHAAGLALLAGFPDRLAARRRPGQFQLRTGSGAWVADDDPLATAELIVAADLDGKRSGARIRLGAAVDRAAIADVLTGVVEDRRLEWVDGELVERVERRLDALRLGQEQRRPEPGEATTAALVARVRTTKLEVLTWTRAARQLQARVALLRDELGDTWSDLSDGALLRELDKWLAPNLVGATGRADLARLDIVLLLRTRLSWPAGAELDELAPTTWKLPSGRDSPIDYRAERPTVSVRVQDVFGVTRQPTVAGGRVPLTLVLLSPADRTIQITADLPGFWAGSWKDVRKDLAGRYPKHRWPQDPAPEAPGRQRDR
ncbi:MAG: ATP-dependent helicase HrpB [Ilumatobacteraceae bacterium]